jgi:uncharacterized protein (TIGR02646 family)
MRTVRRKDVVRPRVFDDGERIQRAVEAYRCASKKAAVNSAIYAAPEVTAALKRLYLSKCAFCEADARKDGVVEHFLPHDPSVPERAYDWQNLHWACDKCNKRKSGHEFKDMCEDTRVVHRTLLIDPSKPHGGTVEAMLTFSPELEAHPTSDYANDHTVHQTAVFLNDPLPHNQRNTCYRKLTDVLVEFECRSRWRQLLLLPEIDPDSWDAATRAGYLDAMEKAFRLYTQFLADDQPFCTSMRRVFEARFGIPVAHLKRLGDFWREFCGIEAYC